MMVAPFRTPASSSVTNFTACWPAGICGAEERRREVLKRQSLDAIDDGGGKILVAQPDDPLRELAAERLAGGDVGRRRSVPPPGGSGDGRWSDAGCSPGRETRTEKAPAIDVHAAPRFLLSGLTFRKRSSLQRVG